MAFADPIKDPQNPNVEDYDPQTPRLVDVFAEATRAMAVGLKVSLPACVTAVSGTQKVDVQPTIQARYSTSSDPVTLPLIKDVPVLLPMGQNYTFKVPIAVGDTGLLIFSDRSIDTWSQSDGRTPTDPQDARLHDISDAIFAPGLPPFSRQFADTTSDMVLRCGNMAVRLQQNGRISLGSTAQGGQEMVNLLEQLLQSQIDLMTVLTSQTFTNTMLGPMPFLASSVAAINKVQATVKGILQNLDTLKAV
ncbi:MAG: hypothetical protein EOP64_00310 [Sphingomonas sp.]|nr:MAG: hypothetical protein EOP64_00310 [Sphingomonas sp.]